MTQAREYISPVMALIIQWRALALMAVAMGRKMSLETKRDPRAAVQTAERLEVWLRFALFTLVGELAALHADGEDHWHHSEEVQYLRQITGALAALALLTAKIKRGAVKRLGGVTFEDLSIVAHRGRAMSLGAATQCDFGFLDSG